MSSETSHLHSIAGAKVATRSARERLHTASESLHGQNDRAARISRQASRADTDAFAGGADTSEPTRKSWSHPPRGNRGTMARELTACERADRVAMSMYPSISPVMNACRYCRPNATSMGGCHVGCGGSVTERPQGYPTLGSQADSCPSVRSLQCVWTHRLGRHHRQIDSDRELHLDVAAPAEQRPRGTAPPYARRCVCLFVCLFVDRYG